MVISLSDHFNYRKLIKFVIPSIGMMIFTSVYSVVDGYFVSNYTGKTPFAAINLIFPPIMLIAGIGFMIGTGGSALVSKTLGEGKRDKANQYFTMMIESVFIIGLITSGIMMIFLKDISLSLGATEDMLPYCIVYGNIILAFNAIFMLQNLFQSFFVTAEKPELGFRYTVAAGIGNIIGDFLLVGVFKWGLVGAALATGISQMIGGFLPVIYFLRKNDSLLRIVKCKFEIKPFLKACGNGSSEMMSNIASSVVAVVYNFQLLRYVGENGVAAYGVLMYVNFIFVAIFIGYSIGVAPIVGYNFGAQNTDELKNILRKSFVINVLFGIMMSMCAYFSGYYVANLYVGYDLELLNLTIYAFRVYALSFLLSGLNIFTSSFFTALNNGGVSAFISFVRVMIFQLGAVLVLPLIFDVNGIWYAVMVSEFMSLIMDLIFIYCYRNRYHYL